MVEEIIISREQLEKQEHSCGTEWNLSNLLRNCGDLLGDGRDARGKSDKQSSIDVSFFGTQFSECVCCPSGVVGVFLINH